MNKKTKNTRLLEKEFLEKIHDQAVHEILSEYLSYSETPSYVANDLTVLSPVFKKLKDTFFHGLETSFSLSQKGISTSRISTKRMSYYNKNVIKYLNALNKTFPKASKIWVLDGLVFQNQVAGLKNLAGFSRNDGLVLDALNSAASLNLGAQNPWLTKMDYIEDILGIRDNFCAAYHTGIRQVYALNKLSGLYPNKKIKELSVHAESSGTIVNSVAIESAVAFVENQTQSNNKRILAVDGTWAGGYGSAREGSGFGVNDQQTKKTGKSIWVDRILPAPTKENTLIFLKILDEKLSKKEVAGIYLEPDVVGDLGLITTDPQLLKIVIEKLRKQNVPIILDCVQQLGRSGSYWGENVDKLFSDYPLLIVTTAKSASNGLPFGFVIMPKQIADAAYPLSQITTNQMNGPLLRSLVVATILQNNDLQDWLKKKSGDIEKIAQAYGFSVGKFGLRGKFLNRGIYLKNNKLVSLAQIALFVEDGVLVGATPNSIRYQPMLLEYSDTNRYLAEIIFRRLQKIKLGEISPIVEEIYAKMNDRPSGLARKNK